MEIFKNLTERNVQMENCKKLSKQIEQESSYLKILEYVSFLIAFLMVFLIVFFDSFFNY